MKKQSAEKHLLPQFLSPASCFLAFSFLFAASLCGFTGQLPFASAAEPIQPNQNFEAIVSPTEAWRNVRLIRTLTGHAGTVESLVFSPNGRLLFSGGSSNDGMVKLWWTRTWKRIENIRAHRTAVVNLAMSSDGETLVSCSDDAAVNLWKRKKDEYDYAYTRTFLSDFNNVLALAITSDNETLISGGLDGIRVWDLRTQRPIYTLVSFDNQTYSLAVSPNNSVFASGGKDNAIKLWNVRTGTFIYRLLGHTGAVSTLAFTPNGQTLVSGSYDRTLKVWNPGTGQLVSTLYGHTGQIRSLAIHPNGEVLASASRDGVRLWNLNTGELLALLVGHQDWVESVAFSPDGRTLATGGYDKTIKIWQIP